VECDKIVFKNSVKYQEYGDYMKQKIKHLEDKPVETDFFNGGHTIIANKIYQIITFGISRIIGIFGNWGSGKSSVINILLKQLKTDKKDEVTCFEFDAWKNQSDNFKTAFLRNLIDKLKSEIKDKQVEINNIESSFKKLQELQESVEEERTTSVDVFTGLALILFLCYPYALQMLIDDKNIVVVIIILSLPLLILLVRKFYCNIPWKEVFQIILNKTPEKISTIINKKPEPTYLEFREIYQQCLKVLDNKIFVVVIDNIDRIDPEETREIWAFLKGMLLHNTEGCLCYENKQMEDKVFLLIPVDEYHVKKVFYNENDDEHNKTADSFLLKTFDYVFRVSPPIATDGSKYMEQCFNDVGWSDISYEEIRNLYLIFESRNFEQENFIKSAFFGPLTPRNIRKALNELFIIDNLFQSSKDIDLYTKFAFVIHRNNIENKLLNNKLTDLLPNNHLLLKNINAKQLAALFYYTDENTALQIVKQDDIWNKLINGQSLKTDFESEWFWHLVNTLLSNKNISLFENLCNAVNVLSELENEINKESLTECLHKLFKQILLLEELESVDEKCYEAFNKLMKLKDDNFASDEKQKIIKLLFNINPLVYQKLCEDNNAYIWIRMFNVFCENSKITEDDITRDIPIIKLDAFCYIASAMTNKSKNIDINRFRISELSQEEIKKVFDRYFNEYKDGLVNILNFVSLGYQTQWDAYINSVIAYALKLFTDENTLVNFLTELIRAKYTGANEQNFTGISAKTQQLIVANAQQSKYNSKIIALYVFSNNSIPHNNSGYYAQPYQTNLQNLLNGSNIQNIKNDFLKDILYLYDDTIDWLLPKINVFPILKTIIPDIVQRTDCNFTKYSNANILFKQYNVYKSVLPDIKDINTLILAYYNHDKNKFYEEFNNSTLDEKNLIEILQVLVLNNAYSAEEQKNLLISKSDILASTIDWNNIDANIEKIKLYLLLFKEDLIKITDNTIKSKLKDFIVENFFTNSNLLISFIENDEKLIKKIDKIISISEVLIEKILETNVDKKKIVFLAKTFHKEMLEAIINNDENKIFLKIIEPLSLLYKENNTVKNFIDKNLKLIKKKLTEEENLSKFLSNIGTKND
jgi:hypothetical protein